MTRLLILVARVLLWVLLEFALTFLLLSGIVVLIRHGMLLAWLSGALAAAVIFVGYPNLSPALRRLALWNVRCRRGRRCASLHLAEMVADEDHGPPPGTVVYMEWNCGSCKTRYRGSALVGQDGAYTESGRTRVRATR